MVVPYLFDDRSGHGDLLLLESEGDEGSFPDIVSDLPEVLSGMREFFSRCLVFHPESVENNF
jgi:hypothetical protein